jgi:hypothetical protein
MPAVFILELGNYKMATLNVLTDELEHSQIHELGENIVAKSLLAQLKSGQQSTYERKKIGFWCSSFDGRRPRVARGA